MRFKIDTSKTEYYGRLVEVGQQRPCMFSYATIDGDTVHQCHTFVKCRDYLNDTIVWREMNNFTEPVYGYSYTGKIEEDRTVFLLKDGLKIKDNLKELNQIEEQLGIVPTCVYDTDDVSCVVVIGDKFWMNTTLHLSWYTQAIRAMTYQDFDGLDNSKETCIKILRDMVKPQQYPFARVPKFTEMPGLFAKLEITQKMAAPNVGTMHGLNGFFNNFYSHYYEYPYKSQLIKLLAEEKQKPCAAEAVTAS